MVNEKNAPKKPFLTTREAVLFAMLGAVMFVSKILMETFPNVHLLGMLTMVYTLTFRKKALIPIYVYVLANGLYAGFDVWWLPYLYVWTVLWGVTMLLPKKMPTAVATVVYPVVCALHGLFFGTLYAPVWALVMGFSFRQMLAWIGTGIPFDLIHFCGNLVLGLLVLPLTKLFTQCVMRNA